MDYTRIIFPALESRDFRCIPILRHSQINRSNVFESCKVDGKWSLNTFVYHLLVYVEVFMMFHVFLLKRWDIRNETWRPDGPDGLRAGKGLDLAAAIGKLGSKVGSTLEKEKSSKVGRFLG